MTTDLQDPYNWKMPVEENQCLQTQQDLGYNKFHATSVRNLKLDTRDIQGSQPLLKSFVYTNKETFINRNDDIDGSSPRQLIKKWDNKPDLQLKNEDIKGTKSKVHLFETTRSPTNPLMPVYKLPSYETIEPIYPKFVKDPINTSDIDGAKPTSKVFKPRNQDIYTEVDGSKPKQRIYSRKDDYNQMNVRDINYCQQFVSNRNTNPLLPIYMGQIDESKKPVEFGDIEGSKSIRLHPINKTGHDFSINTKDIPGAWSDTHANLFLRRDERKDFRNPNSNLDIENSQPHTLKRGIQTIRQVDPLMPKYNFPGEKEDTRSHLFPLTASNVLKKTSNFGRKALITVTKSQSSQVIGGQKFNILMQPVDNNGRNSKIQKFDKFIK